MSESLSRHSDPRCTCPAGARPWEVVQSRYPCPIHPEPDFSGIKLLPRIEVPMNFEPIPFEADDDAPDDTEETR